MYSKMNKYNIIKSNNLVYIYSIKLEPKIGLGLGLGLYSIENIL